MERVRHNRGSAPRSKTLQLPCETFDTTRSATATRRPKEEAMQIQHFFDPRTSTITYVVHAGGGDNRLGLFPCEPFEFAQDTATVVRDSR